MSGKFKEEKSQVKAFLESKGIPHFKLIEPKIDPPDVITEIENQKIGIEVTTLISSLAGIKLEKEFAQVFSRTKEKLINSRIDNLVIRIEPKKNNYINRDDCVETIVNACLNKFPQIGSHRTVLESNPVSGIKRITAYKPVDKKVIITFDSRGRYFGSLRKERLQKEIEGKINKLSNAKIKTPERFKSLAENWLLLTIEGTFYAEYAGVHETDIPISITNCFDKIFVYHIEDKSIEEINTFYS